MAYLRRFGFLILVVSFVAAVTWGYFYIRNIKRPTVSALSVLPTDCIIYLRTTDFLNANAKVNSQSLIIDQLKDYSEVNNFCSTVRALDSIISVNTSIREQLEDNALHFAVYEREHKDCWLLTFNLRELGAQDEFAKSLSTALRALQSDEIYRTTAVHPSGWVYMVKSGVVAFSDNEEILRECFSGGAGRFEETEGFREFENTLTESNMLSVYVDHDLYAGSKKVKKVELPVFFRSGISAAGIETSPSEVTLTGYYQPDSMQLFSAFFNHDPQETWTLLQCLPAGTASFNAFGFSTLPDDGRQYVSEATGKFWEATNARAMFNAQKGFYENVSGLICEFTLPPYGQLVALNVADTILADDHLNSMCDTVEKTTGVIYRFAVATGSLQLFQPLSEINTLYATRVRNFVYLSNDTSALYAARQSVVTGKLISSNASFQAYSKDNFPDEFNYLVYNCPSRSQEMLSKMISFTTLGTGRSNPFLNLKHFSFSLQNSDKNFRYRMHLQNEAETGKEEEQSLWTFKADSAIIGTPSRFVNHITRENEIVCQDALNNLYLVNAKGSLLWKIKVQEKIMSEIFTVDAYRNNKYQIFFSTANYLHLIDRNGRYVQGFPVKLPAPATAPVSVFDYSGQRDYRVFVPCADKKIYNYTLEGSQLEGFAKVVTEEEVNLAVQYLKLKESEYLLTIDKEGRIYIFSRRGAPRINLVNRAVAGCGSFFIDAGINLGNTHIVYLDEKTGLINKISLSDKKEIVRLPLDSPVLSAEFVQADENRQTDILVCGENYISAFNMSGNLLFEKDVEVKLSKAGLYNLQSGSFIYALSGDSRELISITEEGTSRKFSATTFPLLVDLFKEGKTYMLIANGQALTCMAVE